MGSVLGHLKPELVWYHFEEICKYPRASKKEEKIAEQKIKAEEMSFYGQIRRFYSLFAMFWLCLIRVVFKYVFQFRPNACAFVFPIVSLTIINLPVTAVIALCW